MNNIYYLLLICLVMAGCSKQDKHITYELNSENTLKLVHIQHGSFLMGSPENEPHRCPGWWSSNETQHSVTLTKNFYLSETEITQGQWESVMGWLPYDDTTHCVVCNTEGSRNWKINYPGDIGHDKPITGVKIYEAQAFCDSLSKKFNRKFRLPTEAEWEYASRAGSSSMFCFGNDTAQLRYYAVYGRSYGCNERVASRKPNAWGLYDMHGNVWEWVSDLYNNYPTNPQIDPLGPEKSDSLGYRWPNLMRGGCAVNDAFQMRSACRHRIEKDFCNSAIGFRVLMEESSGRTLDF